MGNCFNKAEYKVHPNDVEHTRQENTTSSSQPASSATVSPVTPNGTENAVVAAASNESGQDLSGEDLTSVVGTVSAEAESEVHPHVVENTTLSSQLASQSSETSTVPYNAADSNNHRENVQDNFEEELLRTGFLSRMIQRSTFRFTEWRQMPSDPFELSDDADKPGIYQWGFRKMGSSSNIKAFYLGQAGTCHLCHMLWRFLWKQLSWLG
ncbi:hypothetical protein Vafri_16047 [Volvox africanus]|uniref:Uncharacterized protein n=1 Tax=Volvox africanus TaxID=51714 RepID=A0A8J4F6A1_9CHLO|nr:hypothetical protein Vafri_16047 [Volvox africanus]